VTLAALVLVPRRRWPIVLAAAAATEILLDTSNGTGLVPSLGYALANTSEPLVGALLLTTVVTGAVDLSRTRHLGWFLGCAVAIAPVVGGVVAATTFVYVDGHSGWARFAFEWWSGDGLGVLVVGSAILALVLIDRVRPRRALEGALLATLAVTAAALVFELGRFEFLYVPVALLVVLAFRAGTTIVAVTGALVAFASAGITAEADQFWQSLSVSPANRILYLQLALAILLASVLALAAEIAERERIALSLARTESERSAAIERAALTASERAALQRTERLQALTASLAAAATVSEVVEAVAENGLSVLEGVAGFVALPTPEGTFDIVSSSGYAPDVIASWSPLPAVIVDPVARAADGKDIVFIGPPASNPLAPAPPEVDAGSAAAAPLLATDGRLLGVVYVAFHGRRTFDHDDHAMLQTLARQGSQALERATAYEQEQQARRRAEVLERHAAALASTQDVEQIAAITMEHAGQLPDVRQTAVQILDGKTLRLVGMNELSDIAVRFAEYAIDVQTPPSASVITGKPSYAATVEELEQTFPPIAEVHAELGIEAAFAAPFHASDGSIRGTLSVTSARPHRPAPEIRALVVALAEQTGLAVERAQLKAETDAAAADVALLSSLSDVLVRSIHAHERAHALVAALCSSRVEIAAIHLLDDRGRLSVFERASSSSEAVGLDDSELVGLASRAIAGGSQPTAEAGGLQLRSVALRARNRPLGALTVGVSVERVGISPILLPRIGFRAALAIDNALLYEREREVSHSLQLGLLGDAPRGTPQTAVASAYRPGTEALEVGGDWYDAFELPGGRLALLVGDVVGHGLDAAVAMGQLRGAVRALAPLGSPAQVLERLDRLIDTLPEAAMATLAYGEADLEAGQLVYACAGHPPPVFLPAEGEPELLWEGRSTPLGSSFGGGRPEATRSFAPGDTIVLYTDGLVERRTAGISIGLDTLVESVRAAGGVEPSALVERILTACLSTDEQEDDVCVLAVSRLADRFAYEFPAAPVEVAGLRHSLATWLEGVEVVPELARDVVLATSEAAANAAEHAYGFDGEGLVRVAAWMEADEVVVSVSDEGTWREPDPDSERGRGRTIMEALIRDVTIDRGDDGTRVRMSVPARQEIAV